MSLPEKLEEYAGDLEILNDRDSFEYIIELGKSSPGLSSEKKSEANIIKGCTSNAFLVTEIKNGSIYFQGDADSIIVKGYLRIIAEGLSNLTPKELLENIDLWISEFLKRTKLNLSMLPSRSNAFTSMISKMKEEAKRKKRK